jgi:hypothetical protein
MSHINEEVTLHKTGIQFTNKTHECNQLTLFNEKTENGGIEWHYILVINRLFVA